MARWLEGLEEDGVEDNDGVKGLEVDKVKDDMLIDRYK